jgi:hypothetical protein
MNMPVYIQLRALAEQSEIFSPPHPHASICMHMPGGFRPQAADRNGQFERLL